MSKSFESQNLSDNIDWKNMADDLRSELAHRMATELQSLFIFCNMEIKNENSSKNESIQRIIYQIIGL